MSANTTTLVPATTISEADQRKLGAALTEQYHRAQCAQLEIIAFGAMCMEIELAFSGTRATNSSADSKHLAKVEKRGPGRFAAGTGLKGWLSQYAPDVEYTRARRYRDIAEALVGRLKLAGAEQLKQLTLADTEAAPLEGKMARKRDELIELVTDKSVRALQMELDLSDPIPQRGGPREKKPASDEPAAPAKAPDWCSDPEKELWGTLTDDQQRAAFQVFRPWIHEFHEQLTDGKRTLLPHLDERTRQDLVSTAEDLLRNLEPGLLRRAG
jgi:hypothetical protein